MGEGLLDVVLAGVVVAAGAAALWGRREGRAVGWYVGCALTLAVASLWLGAPGVAVAEAAVGAAATGWLLWRVAAATDPVDCETVTTGD